MMRVPGPRHGRRHAREAGGDRMIGAGLMTMAVPEAVVTVAGTACRRM